MSLLDTWAEGQHTADAVTYPTYRKGSGPGVIVIHEIPGLTPAVIGFHRSSSEPSCRTTRGAASRRATAIVTRYSRRPAISGYSSSGRRNRTAVRRARAA